MNTNFVLLLYRYALLAFLITASTNVFSQELGQINKPAIDTSVLGKWPMIGLPKISNDGKYSIYTVNNKITKETNLYIVSNTVDWRKEIPSVTDAFFSNNSKQVYFMKDKDSLAVLDLKSKNISYTPRVNSFSIAEDGDWVAYLMGSNIGTLTIKNTNTGKIDTIVDISHYSFSKNGKVLLVTTETKEGTETQQSLLWIDLASGKIKKIWTGKTSPNPYACVFDENCQQLAFIAVGKAGSKVLGYYQEGTEKAKILVDDQSPELQRYFSLSDGRPQFSRKGDKLLFKIDTIVTKDNVPLKKDYVDVNVWNYKDSYLQSDQQKPVFSGLLKTTFWAVLALSNQKIVRLNHGGEELVLPNNFEDFFLVGNSYDSFKPYYDKMNWDYKLVSASNGSRRPITDKHININIEAQGMSPNDRFFVWFDLDTHHYFSYDVLSGKKRDITTGIQFPVDNSRLIKHLYNAMPLGIVGWQNDSKSVLVYDEFDIWKIDLFGINAPVNITNGYGRRNNIVFSIVAFNSLGFMSKQKLISYTEDLLLGAINETNKYTGFWKASNADSPRDPVKLTMSACYCGGIRTDGGDQPSGFVLIKAKNSKEFLIEKQTASEFPNLYVTTDFKSYKSISDLHPEKKYNWLTSELISWKMTDGKMSQGVLYKPENFNSAKKYPIIFCYYVRQSNMLNGYETPNWATGAVIDIPYYVSNGYLVFMPDIYYEQDRRGESVVNSVVSAAQYISKLPYVDSAKMAVQGHSFAGWETNYLITHSNIFAAANVGAGVSDEISYYYTLASLPFGSGLHQSIYSELNSPGDPYGPDVTPSKKQDLYTANSPVLSVEKVTTPLLIFHGNQDPVVSYQQGQEMFLAMRRAGKKTWLLQYMNGGHGVHGNDAKDYTVRMKQFFDYYLKGNPPPVWMTKGVPANRKGIDTGLELDLSGAKP